MEWNIGDTFYLIDGEEEPSIGEILATSSKGFIVTYDWCDDEAFIVKDMNDGYYSKSAPPPKEEQEAIKLLKGLGYTVLPPDTTTEGA